MPDEGVLRVVVVRKGKVKPTEFRLRDGETGLSLFQSSDQTAQRRSLLQYVLLAAGVALSAYAARRLTYRRYRTAARRGITLAVPLASPAAISESLLATTVSASADAGR